MGILEGMAISIFEKPILSQLLTVLVLILFALIIYLLLKEIFNLFKRKMEKEDKNGVLKLKEEETELKRKERMLLKKLRKEKKEIEHDLTFLKNQSANKKTRNKKAKK